MSERSSIVSIRGKLQLKADLQSTTFAYNCHMQSAYAILTTRLQLS